MKLSSFKYAFDGIKSALIFRYETDRNGNKKLADANFKIMFASFLLVLIFNIVLKVSSIHWIVTLICCGMCLGCELVNSAIENCIDLISNEDSEKARLAKDFGAGASLILSIISASIAAIIYLPYIFNIIK